MAARKKRIVHDDNTRAKIQTSQIINRLSSHILGKLELSATQIRAAEILLKKTLPDLQQTTIEGGENPIHYVVSSDPVSTDEWLEKYAPSGSLNQDRSTH